MNLSTKTNRIKYGKEAETKVTKLLEEKNITYELTEDKKPGDYKYDMENGDIFISSSWGNKVVRTDVKRGSISFNSIDNFKGEVFLLTDSNMEFFVAFPSAAMRKYKKTCLDKAKGYTQLPSGDWGIRFNPRKLVHLYNGKFINKWIDDDFKL